jgi:glycosyltransferase involved in cell wall biosynthesis
MRIAAYVPNYEDLGGIREIVRGVGSAIVARGHSFDVVGRAHRGGAAGRREPDPHTGGSIYRVRVQQGPHRGAGWRAQRQFLRRFPPGVVSLVRYLRAVDPEVVTTYCSKFHAPYVLGVRLGCRAAIAVTLQNGAQTADGPESAAYMRLMLRVADRVIACSPHVAEYAVRVLPSVAGRVAVVPNGIQPSDYASVVPATWPRPYALALGRLHPQKGFDLLVDAFALANPPVDLLFAGGGPERAALEARVAAAGIGDRVHFLGEVDRARAASLLRGSRVTVIPSRFEGHPLVCLEAMAAGAAVIATEIPGLPEELVSGTTGIVTPQADVPALAAAIRDVVGDEARARSLGAAARAAAARFLSWRDIADRLVVEYAAARDHRTRPSRGADVPVASVGS